MLRGPALVGDRLTGQVHHPLGVGQGLEHVGAPPGGGISGISLEPGHPAGAGAGAAGNGAASGAGRLPAQQRAAVPFPLQQGHQFTADEAGTSEQKQPHRREDALVQR